MKEFKLEEMTPKKNVEHEIWSMFNILRGSIAAEEYHVILFLLSLYKEDLKSANFLPLSENSKVKENLQALIHDLDDTISAQYLLIYETFESTLQRLSSTEVNSLLGEISKLVKELLLENFAELFDNILFEIENLQGNYRDNIIQPAELTQIIFALARLNKKAKVFNPFAGVASFGVYLDQNQEYFGQEINKKTWAIGALRLMAYNKTSSSLYVCEDSILHWPHQSKKFDFVVANPPFNMRLTQKHREVEPDLHSIEQFFIEKGLSSLNSQGKLIALLPQGFLFSAKYESFRETLVKTDLVESVISLPSNIFNGTAIASSLIVLNKNKNLKGKTVFINAQDCFIQDKKRIHTIDGDAVIDLIESKDISNQRNLVDIAEIQKNKFSLIANRYIFDLLEVNLKEESNLIKLKHLISPSPKERVKPDSFGKYIRIRDLSDDIKKLQRSFDDVEADEVPKQAFVLFSNSLMLATRWKKLKPTFYLSGKDPVFYSQDIQSFSVNEEKVDLEYLLQELTEDYVQSQVDRLSSGAFIPYISRKDILDIKIKYPSKEDQKQIVLKRLALQVTRENLIGHEKHTALSKDIADQNVYLRHHIAGPLGQVQKSFQSIMKIIEGQIVNNLDNVMDFKSNPNSTLTFRRHLDIINRDLNSISRSLNKTSKESDLADFKSSKTDFVKFILDYFAELKDRKSKDYLVVLLSEAWIKEGLDEFKVSKVLIDADESFLRKLFDNLIENAEVHGFKKSIFDAHKLEFEVMFSFESNEMQINVSNTGDPLPDNFSLDTYKRKGGTAGESGGDGYGGWFVNETMKKLNGKVYAIDDEFYTEYQGKTINKFIVELMFPINLEFYE